MGVKVGVTVGVAVGVGVTVGLGGKNWSHPDNTRPIKIKQKVNIHNR